MRDLRETFEKLPGHQQALDIIEIEAITHRLAGSAGTFGFEEIGAAAITLEDIIILAREPAAILEWSDIASAIDRIVMLISATRS